MFQGKKILLCITGSIAAYKSVILLRLLIKNGAEVKVIMTEGACDFVSPLTFSTLSKNKVLTNLFDEEGWTNHVLLGLWADVMLIAPASCNTMAKMANGFCDNILLGVYLSSTSPVFIAPAMDEEMFHHPATKRNMEILRDRGNRFLPVNNGELASGLTGEGRMAEPEQIMDHLNVFFSTQSQMKGRKVLVTAGPTYEALDPVRFIGNRSSGKMGVAIAEELYQRGAEVHLILGPTSINVSKSIHTEKVFSADEMYAACMEDFDSFDIIVMAAAVSDYAPKIKREHKIKKDTSEISLPLIKTKDILRKAGELKKDNQILVGFALETDHEKQNAIKKLSEKNADILVLNSLNDPGAGFGLDTNKITIFDKKKNEFQFSVKTKKEVAVDIVNAIIQYENE